MRELGQEGEVQHFKDEFKDLVETRDGPIVNRDEQLEEREGQAQQEKARKMNEDLGGLAPPDDREKEAESAKKQNVVKKQAMLRGEDQADKRETDPEYLDKLDEYKRAQEALRLKQDAFS